MSAVGSEFEVGSTRYERASRLAEKLGRELTAIITDALADPEVIEIVVNPDGRLYVEKLGAGAEFVAHLQPDRVMGAIKTVAHIEGAVVTVELPRLECTFPLGGHRFTGQIPPIVDGPSFQLRKRAARVFSFDDFIEQGVLAPWHVKVLNRAILDRKNIVIAGGTSSGKTTFMNSVIEAMTRLCPHDRFVSAEDLRELQCNAANKVMLQTTEHVTMRDLVRSMLRMTPDRILCGEVRDGAMFELLKAWNTGHPGGVVTLHSNEGSVPGAASPTSAVGRDATLRRIEALVAEATPSDQRHMIGEAIDYVVNLRKIAGYRRVTGIFFCEGYDQAHDSYRIRRLESHEQGRLMA